MEASNGTQSEARARPYVVLEQVGVLDFILTVLKGAEVVLEEGDWAKIKAAINEDSQVYTEVERVPSRNAAHALMQVGRKYDVGVTPPLVAVSERMFKPRQVSIEAGDPRVVLA